MKQKLLIILFLIITVTRLDAQNNYKYLFVGHTYMGETKIDSRLSELDKSSYDQIWLGGDICSETLMHPSTLEYLQNELKICEPHNYFSFGNHDRRNGNMDDFESYTGKKSYYADNFNNITCLVIDTNLAPDDCENLNNQYKMICNVADTIEQSTHLILLFHWGVWDGIPGLLEPEEYCHSNMQYWNANCDSANNNFSQMVYPQLVEVKNRGVEVICIMGDMGASYKKVDMRSDDDIVFLGCGLYNIKYRWEEDQWWPYEKDLILELDHNTETNEISWTYRDLDSLLFVQNGFKYLQKITFDDYENYPAENMVFVSAEDYRYKFNSFSEEFLLLDTLYCTETQINNDFVLTGVFNSDAQLSGDQIEIIFRLYDEGTLIDEKIETIGSLPTDKKYVYLPYIFDTEPQIGNNLQVIVKSISSVPVFMNNVTVMFDKKSN